MGDPREGLDGPMNPGLVNRVRRLGFLQWLLVAPLVGMVVLLLVLRL